MKINLISYMIVTMNRNEMQTYCEGFYIKDINRDITKADHVEICENATKAFREKGYITDNEYFVMEAICEGGWVIRGGRFNKDQYKTIRFHPQIKCHGYSQPQSSLDYPCINEQTVLDEWRTNEEPIWKFKKGFYMRTWLKAFDHAPRWTRNELETFAEVINAKGMKVYNYPALSYVSRDKKTKQ